MPHLTAPEPHIPDDLLNRFSTIVADRLGLCIPPKRWASLRKVLRKLGPELGCATPEDCAGLLQPPDAPAEALQALANQITVGETYFFRDKPLLSALERHFLAPLIEERRGGSRRLRILSAGCATGEEAYTLAILVHRLLMDRTGWHVSVLGVDVNESALAKARSGVYSAWSFRRAPDSLRDAYFLREGDRHWRIKPELHSLVSFSRLNLAEGNYPSELNGTTGLDLVLCRNVLMYFVPEVATEVVCRLRDGLAPGGCLVLAPSEAVLAKVPGLEPTSLVGVLARTGRPTRQPDALIPPGRAPVELPKPAAPARPPATPPALPRPTPPRAKPESRPPIFAPTAESPLQAAQAHYSAGRYAAAVEAAESFLDGQALAEGPDWAKAVGILARALANLNEHARADQALLRAICRDKLSPTLRYLRASILLEEGRQERRVEAESELRHALYLDPDYALAHFLLGNIAQGDGRSDAARKHFANAREIIRGMAQDQVLNGAGGMSAGSLASVLDAIAGQEASHERRR